MPEMDPTTARILAIVDDLIPVAQGYAREAWGEALAAEAAEYHGEQPEHVRAAAVALTIAIAIEMGYDQE